MAKNRIFSDNREYKSRYYSRIGRVQNEAENKLTNLYEKAKPIYEALEDYGEQILARSAFGNVGIKYEDFSVDRFKEIERIHDRISELEDAIKQIDQILKSNRLDPERIRTHTGKSVGNMVREYMEKLSRAEQKELEATYFDASFEMIDYIIEQSAFTTNQDTMYF